MRMHHRLYNPRPRRRKNVRAAADWVVGVETVHINRFTKAPDFIYYIEPPSVKGDKYDYKVKSLGGMELRSGSGTLSQIKQKIATDFKQLTEELTEERGGKGLGGAFEAQTYAELDPLFPGQEAKSPAEEYTGYEIVVRREYPDEDPGYYFYAVSTDGEYTSPETGPVGSRGEAEARAHIAAGSIAGMREFMEGNPTTRKKFKKWVERKGNPLREVLGERAQFGKRALGALELEKMPQILGIPADSAEAALFGYYMGVLRGMKTCGIAKVYDRYKIRKRIKKLLEEQWHELGETAIAQRGVGAATVTKPYRR